MEQNMGLSLIHEADPFDSSDVPICDIVFVHGLGGHPHKTWTHATSTTYWPRDFLPASIPSARILTYGYDLSIASFDTQTSVSTLAESLLDSLAEQRTPSPQENRRLIFIAHSLGGVVVKKALVLSQQSRRREIFDATIGIVFLGTPHGSGSFENISRILQYFWPTLVGEKAQRSRLSMVSELLHIQKTFKGFLDRKLHQFRLISFFEELPIPGFGLVVDEHLEPPSPYTILPIHADHRNICKYTDSSEPNYQLVLGELNKLVAQTWTQKRTWLNIVPQDCLLYLQVDNGSDRIASPSAGTCEWIFGHKGFTSWMAIRQNSIFWICGKPGSGKSTLSKYISKRLTDEVLESPGTITVSFFFGRTSDIDRAPTGFLRSLLYQMFSQCSTDMGDLLSRASNQRSRSIASSRYRKLSSPWTSENLFRIFEESLVRISKYQKVFFIVDALDECSEAERANVMSISSLIQSGRLETPVKLCLTGRHSPEWKKLCTTDRPNIWKITLEDENSVDIKRFTELRITDLIQDSEDECKERIVKALLTKASGVFLWAFLAMKDLERGLQSRVNDPETLELSISNFPNELDDIYSTILDRITHANRHNHALAALAWVCFARRPLSVVELQRALSVDGAGGFSAHEAGISLRAASVVEDWLFSHFGGFLEVVEPGQQVQLIHQTARDFLLQETPWSLLPRNKPSKEDPRLPYPQGVHNWLAEACLIYLKLSYDKEKNGITRKWLRDESDGFLNYAVDYWTEHVKLSDVPSTAHFTILKYLDWPSTRVLGHWAHLHQKTIGDGTSSEYWGWTVLHAAAAFGLHSLALAILEVECSNLARWDIGDANGRTPLSLAAEQGNLELVKLLLDAGAGISTTDNRYGLSPLHWAAMEGHKSIVKLLLEKGAEVNVSDSSGTTSNCTALSVAAAKGHKEIVKLLLENGANNELFGLKNGWTALNLSAGYGHKAVVKLLIDWGADPNVVNPYTKQTPLYYATAGGHLDVIRFLLDHGGGMPQAKTRITTSIPMSWTHRVAYSLIRLLDYTSNSTPRECPSSKTKSTYSSSSVPAKRQRDDNSEAGSSKRLCNVLNFGEGSGDGGSGNDPNKPPISNPAPPSSLKGPSVRLACPYFKFDPERYGSPSRCAGPRGWPDMNRLKEHLYHNHFVHLCQKCNLLFENEEDLDKHYKAIEPCSARRDRDYGAGFSENQRQRLKARTGKREAGGTELEYWKWVYSILFPNVQETPVPVTPFYEERDLDKKPYDDHCALMRKQSPDLRRRLIQAIHDPYDADPITTILALINDHQAGSVNLPASRANAPVTVPSGNFQQSINDLVPDDQPFPFQALNSGSTPFLHLSNSWDFQQDESEMDSGFHSGLSAPTERDPLISAGLSTVSNVVEGQVTQTLDSAPEAGDVGLETGLGPNLAGDFDVEDLMRWSPNAADASSAADPNPE